MRRLETELADRTLRFDGVSILHPDDVADAMAVGLDPTLIRVSELTTDVERFNANVTDAEQLRLATPEPIRVDMAWRLPEKYQTLDLEAYITDIFSQRAPTLHATYTPQQVEDSYVRIADELEEIRRRGMTEFLKTIIYILDVFRAQNVVWGVGRGSSCASYVLFILGLHAVDAVKLNVPLSEFFHD